jgi:hypothetical protein
LSFNRPEKARKAIANRGWGPLNYILLDSPALIPAEKTMPTAFVTKKRKEHPEDLNINGPVASTYLTMILEDKQKSEGLRWGFLSFKTSGISKGSGNKQRN